MRNELDFAEHSHLLGQGLFADKVVLALSRSSKARQLDEQERETLERAKVFLSEVIKGGNFSTGVFSAQDMASVKAFTHAVDSVTIRVSSKSDFLRYVDELLNTVTKVLANEHVSDEELALITSRVETALERQRAKARLHNWVCTIGLLQYVLAPTALAWSLYFVATRRALRYRLGGVLTAVVSGVSIVMMFYRGYYASLGW